MDVIIYLGEVYRLFVGDNNMFSQRFPEYPESAMIFSFRKDVYLKPKQHKEFFKAVKRVLGEKSSLRSFTMFENSFREISFWIDENKVGSVFQRWSSRIRGEPSWMMVDAIAQNLVIELSNKFDIETKVKISQSNKRNINEQNF